MDNFDLKKYLAEGRIFEYEEDGTPETFEEWGEYHSKDIRSNSNFDEDVIDKVIDDLVSVSKNLLDEQHPYYSDYASYDGDERAPMWKKQQRALYEALTKYLRIEYKINGQIEKLEIAKNIFFNEIRPGYTGGGDGSYKRDWEYNEEENSGDFEWEDFLKKYPQVKDENLAGEVYYVMQEQNAFDDYDDEEIVDFMKAAATWTDAEDVADYFDEPASDIGKLIAGYYQEESGYEDYPDQWDNYLDYLFQRTERDGNNIDDWRIPDN